MSQTPNTITAKAWQDVLSTASFALLLVNWLTFGDTPEVRLCSWFLLTVFAFYLARASWLSWLKSKLPEAYRDRVIT